MFSIRSGFLSLLMVAASAVAAPAIAGSIALSWDATPGATGYYVYYGTESGHYNPVPVTTACTCRSWPTALRSRPFCRPPYEATEL